MKTTSSAKVKANDLAPLIAEVRSLIQSARRGAENASAEPRDPSTLEPHKNAGTHPGNAGLCTRQPDENASAEPLDPSPPRGWHSRGYMPHFDSNTVIQHVTFHLADSLPKEVLQLLMAEVQELDPDLRDIEKRRRLEALVDAGHGVCWLRRPDCAQIVQDSLLHFDGERYRMIAWVVMPNHVHALFQTLNEWSMNSVVRAWKTFTANAIGQRVRQPNEPAPHVWHPEFWDRFIRDEKHFANAMAYIHNNPVKAGLVAHPEQWLWSSAHSGNAGTHPGNAGLCTRPPTQSQPTQSPPTQPTSRTAAANLLSALVAELTGTASRVPATS